MSKRPGFVGFVDSVPDEPSRPRNYDPSRLYPPPLTDDEVRERIKSLEAENARLRARQLMRQMGFEGSKNRG